MLKITSVAKVTQKVCRLELVDAPVSKHRFIEKTDGSLVYQMGNGETKKIDVRAFRTLIRTIVVAAKSHEVTHLAIDFTELNTLPKIKDKGESWIASTLAENLLLANYEFRHYKTKAKKTKDLAEVQILNLTTKEAKAGLERGKVVGEYLNKSRDISNLCGSDLTPANFGKEAQAMAKGLPLSVKVLGEKEILKLKMGALYAVGQGSENETKFIVVEYWGKGKDKKDPTVLIGKGITYDTGGLNVKPSGYMHDMHMDMSGGSVVLATICAAAKLKLKKNIVALIPTAENAISDKAMRAGDIIKTMSGQSVEVLHTDAEGRLILADALTYSAGYKPKTIIDVATLTGASLSALGQHASAIMTKHPELSETLVKLGEESGDLVWPLPLWDEYKQHLKSTRADISNIATNFSRYGGAIEGGTFLSHFAPKDVPWVHIDMAPRMESIGSDKLAKGATGEPLRLLLSYLEQN